MTANLLSDVEVLSIKDVARLLPNHPHYSTVVRWAKTGVRGRKLATFYIGGVLYTTPDRLESFVAALNTESSC